MQNMLLMAHALGLGAVWLTFVGNQQQAIRQRFRIPDYIDIVSYISIGWPAIEPLPPGRMELEAVLLPDH
jgi:nitroreductase